MRCPSSKLANLVRLTADEAERMGANVGLRAEPGSVLNLVREFALRRAAGITADVILRRPTGSRVFA